MHKGSLLFYKHRLKEKNKHLYITSECNFKAGDYVLVSGDSLKNNLSGLYQLFSVDKQDQAELFRILK
ncbi:MAG: hypothetical protein N3F09_04220 [Bacteroidia bacterium]|nr:hypothetical protein [Bacteroidia bacterium]